MANIILSILAVLLMVFPNCTRLQAEYNSRELARDFTGKNIVCAINEQDIDALEDLMCGNIKMNTPELQEEIKKMIDLIDGKIIDFTWSTSRAGQYNYGNGKSLMQKHYQLDFTTAKESYRIAGILEYYNSFQPEEIGIRSITLHTPPTSLTWASQIRATDGVGEWHE